MGCFFFKKDIVLVYIYPIFDGRHQKFAERFVSGYMQTHPSLDHRLVVVSNGGAPSDRMIQTFGRVNVTWMAHDNSGWDIGAYQHAARDFACDIMVFFSNSTYFTRPGWLDRMVDATEKHGLALYGTMGNKGDPGVKVYPHIRTTGFWVHPELMNAYPKKIAVPQMRYEFEHGKTCFCEWLRAQGLKAWVVTFNGDYDYADWDNTGNGYHRGDQSGLLCGDRLTEPPYYPPK